jgi:hypothetical protein
MKNILKFIFYKLGIYSLFKRMGIINIHVIRFDGGLGSQLLSFMQYYFLSKFNKSIKADVSFFNLPAESKLFSNDTTYRKWKLNYYGIDHKSYFLKSNVNSVFNFLKLNTDDQMINFEKFLSMDYKSIEWCKILPISSCTLLEINKIIDYNNFEYGVIHIRRGDFLQFSSYVIDDNKIEIFLNQLKNILPFKLLILSDDIFDENFKNKIVSILKNKEVLFITGGDELLMHGLMRYSNVLITSNSMFSLSAALLQKKGGIAIIPAKFYGGKFLKYNHFINLLSDWTFLNNN